MPESPVLTILLSRDVRAAMDFYHVATGWSFEACPDSCPSCWVAKNAAGEFVAIFVDASGSDFPDAPELWLPYLSFCDLDHSIVEAEKLGATVLHAPAEIAGLGRVALLRQPGGSIVGWRSRENALAERIP